VDQIRAEQQEMIDDQDRGLGELSKALRRQQQMGLDMQDEIQEHNGIAQCHVSRLITQQFLSSVGNWRGEYSNGTGSLAVYMVQGRQSTYTGHISSFSIVNAREHSGTVIP
jgi:DUF2075 family protein